MTTAAPPLIDDAPPPLPPARRAGQIEVDTFCDGCHYNLHGQPVTVDERLQIPVCRCPECGRFHPAGVGVSASGTWVRRLGTLLLFVWVGVVVAVTAGLCFVMAKCDSGAVEAYRREAQVTNEGVLRVRSLTGLANVSGGDVMLLHPILGGQAVGGQFVLDAAHDNYDQNQNFYGWSTERSRNGPGPTPFLWASAGSAATGLVGGGLAAVFLWHWPRRRYAWCLLLVATATAFVAVTFATDDLYELVHTTIAGRLAVMALIQGIGVIVGTRVGRPIARAVARLVIPPKPRQLLAFLWQADGRPVPM